MASNLKKTKRIRAAHNRANKKNLKADLKRIQENTRKLKELAQESDNKA